MKVKEKNLAVSMLTLGCAKNVVDSERMIALLRENNYRLSRNIDHADILIINTCGFVKSAKEESIQVIVDAAQIRKKGNLKKLIVAGCLSQRYMQELKTQIEGVDNYIGIFNPEELFAALNPDLKYELTGERVLLTPSHYSFLKISEGCDHKCSFCAIPKIKGKHKSVPMEELLDEARMLADKGVRELNIIAQDTTYYGQDLYGKRKIAELLEKLSEIDNIQWIRMLYAYPTNFPADLLDVMAGNEKICNYIDIPLQHASNNILKSMKRGITLGKTKELINKIRNKLPQSAIRSTFITGYPGETEKDFLKLEEFLNEMKLQRVGVFTYSHEDETAAFKMEDIIPEELKLERKNRLMELQRDISLEHNQALIGKELKVIIDEAENDVYYGRSEFDAPEIDNEVILSSKTKLKPGQIVLAKIDDAEEYDIFGNVTKILI